MNWRTLAGRYGQMASALFSVNRSISTIRAMPWGLNSSFPRAPFNTVKRRHHGETISGHSSVRDTVAPLFLQMQMYRDRVAVVDVNGVHCYSDVIFHANRLTDRISDELNSLCDDGNGNRICILCPNDASYLMAQLATWMSGCVAVPLSDRYPAEQLEYFVRDSDSRIVITTEDLAAQLKPVVDHTGAHLVTLKRSDYCHDSTSVANNTNFELKASLEAASNRWNKRLDRHQQLCNTNQFKNRFALIVYTSGTTGKPKGVVHTYGSLQAQVQGMIDEWKWNVNDVLLHALPLHHVHGNINALITPMSCGACCVMLPRFEPAKVWSYLLSANNVNMLMAVPTMYAKLIEHYNNQLKATSTGDDDVKNILKSKIRLFVSGSAALPDPVFKEWEAISGHVILERYGMTELGMALTNPLDGCRKPGTVGLPFPNVNVRIVSLKSTVDDLPDVIAQGNSKQVVVTAGRDEESGELQVSGGNVFTHYLNKKEATSETFTADGWFKTGDTAMYDGSAFRIMGRTSVDIIKSGGYKLSALDIEHHLLGHPSIGEIAVVGVPDVTWGQKVAAVVVLKSQASGEVPSLTLEELRSWAKQRLPSYALPVDLRIVSTLPRNAMGKLNKKELLKAVFV